MWLYVLATAIGLFRGKSAQVHWGGSLSGAMACGGLSDMLGRTYTSPVWVRL